MNKQGRESSKRVRAIGLCISTDVHVDDYLRLEIKLIFCFPKGKSGREREGGRGEGEKKFIESNQSSPRWVSWKPSKKRIMCALGIYYRDYIVHQLSHALEFQGGTSHY